jgi:protease PrsW
MTRRVRGGSAPNTPSPSAQRYAVAGGLLGVLFFFLICCFLIMVVEFAVAGLVALAVSVVAAVIPAIFFSYLVIILDRYEREPVWILLGTFFWGALVAFGVSYVLNTIFGITAAAILGFDQAEVLTAAVSAPIVEEVAKGSVLLLLFLLLHHEFDNVLDGIVYGSLVGIGFAMTENITYFGRAFVEAGYIGVGISFFLRVVLSGLAHAAYTAATGVGFGIARTTNSSLLKIAAPLGGLGLAIFMHFSWNFFAATLIPNRVFGPVETAGDALLRLFVLHPLVTALFLGPAVLTLAAIIGIVWRREERIIREQLRDEVAAGVITPEEYARLTSTRRRIAHELRVLRSHGPRAWYAQEQLHQAATSLAFRKWHLSRGERPKNDQRTTPDEQYRQRIQSLRAEIPPVVTSGARRAW